jgi:hypothetical protein
MFVPLRLGLHRSARHLLALPCRYPLLLPLRQPHHSEFRPPLSFRSIAVCLRTALSQPGNELLWRLLPCSYWESCWLATRAGLLRIGLRARCACNASPPWLCSSLLRMRLLACTQPIDHARAIPHLPAARYIPDTFLVWNACSAPAASCSTVQVLLPAALMAFAFIPLTLLAGRPLLE